MKGSMAGSMTGSMAGLLIGLGMSLGLAPTWSLAASAAPSGLVQAIQSEIDGEANSIARGYFIQLGEKIAPEDIGFRSEVFLRNAAGGSAGAAGSQTLERILVTAYIPESYPDGMIIDFRAKFRKHFEEQGYVVVFGPEATQVDTTASPAAPWFDFRVRRAPPPWLGEAAPVLSTSLAATAQGGRQMAPKALIQLFGGRVDLDGIKAVFAPLWSQVTGTLQSMGKAELSLVAGAGAAVAFILLVMIALAPLRILRRRQQAQMRYRQYPQRRVSGVLPMPGEPPLFTSGYREDLGGSRVDPEVERIRSAMAQMGIKEVLEILRNLDPHYRDQVLAGLNVHKSIKARIEKALNSPD